MSTFVPPSASEEGVVRVSCESAVKSTENNTSDPATWRQRISALHQGKVTKEELDQIRHKSERKKALQESVTRSRLLERSVVANTKSMGRAFSAQQDTAETLSAEKPGGGTAWSSAATTHKTTHHQLKKVLQDQRTSKDATDSATSLARATAALEAVEKEIDDAEALTGVVVTEETGLAALLLQLAEEPTDDAELAAKFSLYENFMDGVSSIREETFHFWLENKPLFEGAVLAASEHTMKELDTNETMGLDDFTTTLSHSGRSSKPKWFVYHMTKKANDNSIKIGNTLGVLRGRLELLQSEYDDCPFCLEEMKERSESEVVTLSCCHRVCVECWKNWQHIQGPARSFCPICRNVEFLEEIIVDT